MSQQEIVLTGEDGGEYPCQVLGMFHYEKKQYALLLAQKESGPTTVVMEFEERENEGVFRTIQSDEEFERVLAFIRCQLEDMA